MMKKYLAMLEGLITLALEEVARRLGGYDHEACSKTDPLLSKRHYDFSRLSDHEMESIDRYRQRPILHGGVTLPALHDRPEIADAVYAAMRRNEAYLAAVGPDESGANPGGLW